MIFYKIFFNLFCVAFWATLVSSNPILKSRGYEPTTRVFDLTIQKKILAPDGFTRVMSTINGQYPGPTLEVHKGDRIVMKIHNEMGEPTSIHAHGMFQRGTPWFDGVPGMTQCVIPNDYDFTYDFTVPDQAGTYWYHSHAMTQYIDGIVGALIIHDPNDPYLNDYDEEMIVMLTDYHHTQASILAKRFLAPGGTGDEPMPDNGLINGKNNYNCSLAPHGSTCVDNAGLAKFKFEPNKRYRLRIINTSAFSAFFFSIDKHEMEVIEVEGTYTKPNKIHRLPINVAQRYSVIVTANQPVNNYIMRSEFQKDCLPDGSENLTTVVKAIVQYDGAPEHSNPIEDPWKDYLQECIDLKHDTLQPSYKDQPPKATKELEFVIAFHNNSKGANRAFLNESTFVLDVTSPTLNKVFAGKANHLQRNQNAITFDTLGEVVDIIFKNDDDGDHPFHLHGHQFWVLGFGNGTDIDKKKLNTINPIKRDTSTIPAKGWTVFRFVIDNPGVFAIHCHMEWHLQAGLLLQLIELPKKIEKMVPPQEWVDLCKSHTKY